MLDITDPKPKAAPCPVNNNFFLFFCHRLRVLIGLLFIVCLTVVQGKKYSNDQPSSSVFFYSVPDLFSSKTLVVFPVVQRACKLGHQKAGKDFFFLIFSFLTYNKKTYTNVDVISKAGRIRSFLQISKIMI